MKLITIEKDNLKFAINPNNISYIESKEPNTTIIVMDNGDRIKLEMENSYEFMKSSIVEAV